MASRGTAFSNVSFDRVDGLSHGSNLVGFLVGDLDVERLFDGKRQVHQRERVGPEIFVKGRIESDEVFGNLEALLNDAPDLVGNGLGHGPMIRRSRLVARLS